MASETKPEDDVLDPAAAIQLISAVTLTTRDMAASIAFYQSLGMTLRYGGPSAGFSSLQAGNCHINLTAKSTVTPAFWGRIIFHVEDVDASHRQLLAHGYISDTTPADALWGERYFHINDPSGHALSIAKPLCVA